MHSRIVRLACVAVVGFALLVWARPDPAQAIPVFANGQGVSCGQCHSAPPNLNPYGRYIMATNFSKALKAHAQMLQNLKDPVSLILTANASSVPAPNLPKIYAGLVQLNSAGYLGNDVTYYASIPIVADGFPSSGLDQLWFAYNGFSKGNGSFQAGYFPTPMLSPWLSQTMSLAGYALAAMPVGLNTVGIGDNRWGASYSQIGRTGLIGNVAYMSNTGPLERAYNNNVNSLTAGAEGQSYIASLEQMNFNSHFTGGVAVMRAGFPLPSGAVDNYSRQFGLLSYSTAPNYSIIGMALMGQDSNPNDGPGRSGSNGLSLEGIGSPVYWLHLDGRWERTNDGLGGIANNYVGDVAFSVMPNLIATVENVSTVGGTPVVSYQILWAGPFNRRRGSESEVAAAEPAGPQDIAMGQQVFAANCAQCHGANGQGGAGPSLVGIGAKQTVDQTVAFIENPSGAMPKYYPNVISAAQVQAVADYIRATFK